MKLHLPTRIFRKQDSINIDNDPWPVIPRTLLCLPAELILSICDFLPHSDRACLALTCHQLYNYRSPRVFTELDNYRKETVAFLQKIRRDKPNVDLWICYACLRFHSTIHRYEPTNFRPGSAIGFPYCKSIYAAAIDELQTRLITPREEWRSQSTWMEDDITSPVRLSVYMSTLASSKYLYLRRRYVLNFRRADPEFVLNRYSPFSEILDRLGTANLEVCPHVCFGSSWLEGDGSMMDTLSQCSEKNIGGGFTCIECGLEVEVQYVEAKSEVVVLVWQEFGTFEDPDAGIGQRGRMNGLWNQESRRETSADQITGRKLLSPSSAAQHSLVRKDILPSSLSMVLSLMKINFASNLKLMAGFGRGQKSVLASAEPAGSQLATSMKILWESLERDEELKNTLLLD